MELVTAIKLRLGSIWPTVSMEAVTWDSKDGIEPPKTISIERRRLLFHIAALMDVNECEMKFLQYDGEQRPEYMKRL